MGNNGGITIDDGTTRMRLGANGLTIESMGNSVVIVFEPEKNQLYIGRGLIGNIAENVEGNAENVEGNGINVEGNGVNVEGNGINVEGNGVNVEGNGVNVEGVNITTLETGENLSRSIDLCIDGKIVDKNGQDYLQEIFFLKEKVSTLEEKIVQLEFKLNMVYDSPGMPGYILYENEWNDSISKNEQVNIKMANCEQ